MASIPVLWDHSLFFPYTVEERLDLVTNNSAADPVARQNRIGTKGSATDARNLFLCSAWRSNYLPMFC